MRYVDGELLEKLKERFGEGIEKVERFRGEVSITVGKPILKELMEFLKSSPDFDMDMLVDVCGLDFPGHNPRIQVVYLLRSLGKKHHIRVKCWADGDALPTVSDIWKTAEWTERETYEMLGVRFEGRELRKLLLPQKYPHYPLRKDFPLEGYEEPCELWDWE